MSKHLPAGSPGAIKPTDDLERNPGIGMSKGMTAAGADPEIIEGESTFEGDTGNGTNANGGVIVNTHERTNK